MLTHRYQDGRARTGTGMRVPSASANSATLEHWSQARVGHGLEWADKLDTRATGLRWASEFSRAISRELSSPSFARRRMAQAQSLHNRRCNRLPVDWAGFVLCERGAFPPRPSKYGTLAYECGFGHIDVRRILALRQRLGVSALSLFDGRSQLG